MLVRIILLLVGRVPVVPETLVMDKLLEELQEIDIIYTHQIQSDFKQNPGWPSQDPHEAGQRENKSPIPYVVIFSAANIFLFLESLL